MKTRILSLLTAFAAFVLLMTPVLHAQVPQLVNYQGRVAVGTVNFDGSGQFKFALVDAAGTTTYWSNDDSSSGGSQPTAAVTLTVTKGLYSVLLGDTALANMTAIPASVFTNADVRLRVWFNDGTNGFQLLTPDQRLAAVGYAIMAAGVNLPATTSATAGVITQNGSQLLHTFGPDNLFAGFNAGNFALTGSVNTAVGAYSLANTTTGTANTAIGREVLVQNATGNDNTASGFGALYLNTAGSNNTAIGRYALFNSTGTGNLALGYNAGASLATGDNNIYLGNSGAGSESGIIRIGTPGTQTDSFLTGIIHGDGSGLTGVPAATTAGSAINFTGTLTGDVTGTQGATTIPAATVTGKAITGFASGTGTVTASDSILTAINKLNGNTALKAAAGANSDITSLTGLSTALSVSQGGTGLNSPGASGNLLRSNGAAWTSVAPSFLTSEVDGVVGNEVANATNTSLSRSGSGTAGSPFTLALNTGNANSWSAVQTFAAIPLFSGGTPGATAPFTVDSTFLVTNLNADFLDGSSSSAFATAAHSHGTADITSGTFTSARLSGSYNGITDIGVLDNLIVSGPATFSYDDTGPMNVNRLVNDGSLIIFFQDSAVVGSISVSGNTVSYNAFTGSHYAWTDEKIEPGMLVSMTGLNRHRHDDRNSEIIYGIMPSSVPNDPKCLGAYLGPEESSQPASTDNPHLIAAVGNGDMWVVDAGVDIAPGDWLIASHVRGCAMRDDPVKFPLGHVIARAAEPVDWSRVTPRDGIKRAKISVLFESFSRNSESTVLASVIETQKREIAELEKRLTAQEKMNTSLAARFTELENATAQTEKNTHPDELSDTRGHTGNK